MPKHKSLRTKRKMPFDFRHSAIKFFLASPYGVTPFEPVDSFCFELDAVDLGLGFRALALAALVALESFLSLPLLPPAVSDS